MLLTLVRHGLTMPQHLARFDRNRPLSYRGRRQAHLTGAHLQSESLDLLISSDLDRARDTAHIIASYLSTTVDLRPEFREIDPGHWHGLLVDEVRETFAGEYELWEQDKINNKRGGESFSDVEKRVLAGIEKLLEHENNQHILVVCHTAVIRAALSALRCLDREVACDLMIDNCSITRLSLYSSKAEIIALNETSHLTQDQSFVARLKSSNLL